ncbi:MAG: hypothetical protein Q8L54_00790, partial [Devosia sp.]|nr:hypothetical protein [Devosia sp.]
TVRWRPSHGRGEFEFVPADSLEERFIQVLIEPLGVTIATEVFGTKAQGKPRLRKLYKDDRGKMHLPQLVMAIARLPEPARQDKSPTVQFPLENKRFVMESMDFEVVDDDGENVTLAPLRVTVLHSDFVVNLQDRLAAVARDIAGEAAIHARHPGLADAVRAHADAVRHGVNSIAIRDAADKVISLQTEIFGPTNAGSVTALEEFDQLPPSELEKEIAGREGRLLARIHVYKERDRDFAKRARSFYRNKQGGVLVCQACGLEPVPFYGSRGEISIEIHHKTPVSELQPDSITVVDDVAVLCASCHRVVHSEDPCLGVDELHGIITAQKAGQTVA